MRFTLKALLLAAAIAAISPTQSWAAFTVTQTTNTTTLQNAILGTTTGLSGFNTTIVAGGAVQFGTFSDPGAPAFGLDSGIVLSTGNVSQLPNPANITASTSVGANSTDQALLRITFNAATATDVFFQFVFGSEEFLSFAGSGFNDAFALRLNGTNFAKLTNGADVTINNLAASPSGPFNPDYVNNPTGTLLALNGYTKVLTFKATAVAGSNTLEFDIKDVSDRILDSAVFIRGGTLGVVNPVVTAVPAPAGLLLGLTGLPIFGVIARLRRKTTSVA